MKMKIEQILANLSSEQHFDVKIPENYAQYKVDCYNNETGKLNEKDGYNCDKCKNKGNIMYLKNGNEYSRECECMNIRRMIARMKDSGIGEMLSKCTFKNYEVTSDWQKHIKETAIDYVKNGVNEKAWWYIGGQVGCVDCDTEYFNGVEWVRIADYKNGDKVLQYNPENKKATLVKPKEYIKAPTTELYHLIGERHYIDMCLSANHNFAYITTKGHMQKKPFSEVMKMHNETVQGFYGKVETAFDYSGTGIELTDNEIRLMCAVIADGTFQDKQIKCQINVKKERKKERMRLLLSDMDYKEYKKNNGYSRFSFYAPRREKMFSDYWYNCNRRQLEIIAEEVFEWDGSKRGKRRTYFSTSKKSADFIQFALSATGSRATISTDYHRDKPCYVVSKSSYASTVSMCSTGGKNKATIKKVNPADGNQYCFTVDTGYLVLRRNGRIFITGNSGKSHISTAICRELIKQGKRLKYMLWRDDLTYLKSTAGDSTEHANRSARIKELKTVPVLYIDDLFKTGRTNDGQRAMPTAADIATTFEIVNARYLDRELLTLFSSELTTTQLLSVDEGLASRIIERLENGKYALNIGQDIKKNYRLRNSGGTL